MAIRIVAHRRQVSVGQAEQHAAVGLRPAVVTARAVPVEHRLHFAAKREPARRPVPGLDFRGRPGGRQRRPRRRRRVLRFMTADARHDFAGHRREPRPHQLDRLALGVQRLQRDRRVGRHAETGRTVLQHGHGPQDAFGVPGAVQPHGIRLGPHALKGKMVAQHAQRLDGAAGHTLQPRPAVDVGNQHVRILAAWLPLVRDTRRPRRRAQRDRLEHRVPRLLVQQHGVVERVDQVDPPQRPLGRLARDQEVLVAERERVQEFRPAVRDGQVERRGLDRASIAGNPLHRAVRFAPAAGRIEDDQRAHPRRLVMPADDRGHLGRMVRNRPGKEHGSRPVRVAAVVLHLLRAVRVHVEQDPRKGVRQVRVLPTQIQHPAVVQHGRAPVMILLDRQLADPAARFPQVQIGHVSFAVDAGDARETGR